MRTRGWLSFLSETSMSSIISYSLCCRVPAQVYKLQACATTYPSSDIETNIDSLHLRCFQRRIMPNICNTPTPIFAFLIYGNARLVWLHIKETLVCSFGYVTFPQKYRTARLPNFLSALAHLKIRTNHGETIFHWKVTMCVWQKTHTLSAREILGQQFHAFLMKNARRF